MTSRSAALLLAAAVALPVTPWVFARQADEPVAEEPSTPAGERAEAVADDEVTPERAPAKPAAKGQAKTTSRPATRAKGKAGDGDARASGGDEKSATTKPTRELSAEEMLSQMLKPPPAGGSRPLPPLPEVAGGGADRTSGGGAVAPEAPVVNVLREGTFLVDRVGRLGRSRDGSQAEFVFESDGTALEDPPVVIIPNLKLMQMEDAAAVSIRDMRFRVSGMVTEYRGRNHLLLEKVVVVPEVLEKF